MSIISKNHAVEIQLLPTIQEHQEEILSQKALSFLSELHIRFEPRRKALLNRRKEVQKNINAGNLPDFLTETREIRESEWVVSPLPKDLLDRRVEITGPVDRKMIINALNSGAKIFMADFEDSNSPTWKNTIEGQVNLKDAINQTIEYVHPVTNKIYKLNEKIATLMVRPRGWHLKEKHVKVGGEFVSASLFDFGIFFFHNAKNLIKKGSGPYFYLPKLENHLEARLWNDVFVFAQNYLGIPLGTIKATVLIETILASFELHEILYELKEHSAGLNCGRWDYIFSYIKKFRNLKGYVLPDRAKVTMAVPFMSAYSKYVIQACHKRKVHAMGGMAAQIPIKTNEKANNIAIEKVQKDKIREAENGHDGTWVAHPGLVPIALAVFETYMPEANQIGKQPDFKISRDALLNPPKGSITEKGVRTNINIAILYIESWLRGVGAAAIYHLMEDMATAEISRAQLWQWLHNEIKLEDGREITEELYLKFLDEEIVKIERLVGTEVFEKGRFDEAINLLNKLVLDKEFEEFITYSAYELI